MGASLLGGQTAPEWRSRQDDEPAGPESTSGPSSRKQREHAALAEFRATGYEAASMDRIAASAGVSKRTVYNHFPGKEALFTHILEAMLERGQGGVDLPYRADAPLREQLLELVQQKLRLLHDPSFIDLARVVITAGLHSPTSPAT